MEAQVQEAASHLIDPQIMDVGMAIIGGLLMIAGYFVVRTISKMEKRQDAHSERMTSFDEKMTARNEEVNKHLANLNLQVNENKTSIKSNSDRDQEFKQAMEKRENDLKQHFKESISGIEKKIDSGFQEIARNFQDINKEILDLIKSNNATK